MARILLFCAISVAFGAVAGDIVMAPSHMGQTGNDVIITYTIPSVEGSVSIKFYGSDTGTLGTVIASISDDRNVITITPGFEDAYAVTVEGNNVHLTVKSVTFTNSGKLSFFVLTPSLPEQHTNLIVMNPIQLEVEEEVLEGEISQSSCKIVYGVATPADVQVPQEFWPTIKAYIGEEELTPEENPFFENNLGMVTEKKTYNITMERELHGQAFTCKVDGQDEAFSASQTLSVIYPPLSAEIAPQPTDGKYYTPDQTVNCTADSNPETEECVWRDVNSDNEVTGCSLVITEDMVSEDTYEWMCTAIYSMGDNQETHFFNATVTFQVVPAGDIPDPVKESDSTVAIAVAVVVVVLILVAVGLGALVYYTKTKKGTKKTNEPLDDKRANDQSATENRAYDDPEDIDTTPAPPVSGPPPRKESAQENTAFMADENGTGAGKPDTMV